MVKVSNFAIEKSRILYLDCRIANATRSSKTSFVLLFSELSFRMNNVTKDRCHDRNNLGIYHHDDYDEIPNTQLYTKANK